jgi:DNA-binding MarR family transcriptional regulator
MYTNHTVNINGSPSLLSTLRHAYRLSSQEYREHLRPFDLTARQAAALLAIQQSPGEGLRTLAEEIDIDLASCSVLVSRLEARGLVSRVPDEADRRRTCLHVTDEARTVLAEVAEARAAADAKISAALGSDAAVLRRVLERLSRQLPVMVAAGDPME